MKAEYFENMDYETIELDEMTQIFENKKTYSRLSVPSANENIDFFYKKGYVLVDRTLEVKVPLTRNKTDFEKMVRLDIERTVGCREEIAKIAMESFKEDNRFQILNQKDLYGKILDQWLKKMKEAFVCIYKGEIVGFAEITEEDTDTPFIHLAATDEKYRLTGAGMSLYAYCADYYKKEGKRALTGRISSRNVAVMNLYTSLGGQFSKPWDIFAKRVSTCNE